MTNEGPRKVDVPSFCGDVRPRFAYCRVPGTKVVDAIAMNRAGLDLLFYSGRSAAFWVEES